MMIKKLFISLLCVCMVLMTACGKSNTRSDNTGNVQNSSLVEETSEHMDSEESKDTTGDMPEEQIGFEELNEAVSTDVENTVSAIKSEYENLVTEIDTYEKYLDNTDKVKAFYKQVCEDTKNLCIRMREYSVNYAERIMASDQSNEEKYEDFEELYDCIYDDAGDDIYDEIYEGILKDVYDAFYGGILEDAYDQDVTYEEWSDALSNEYDWWSDACSDVYDEWSDCLSDVCDFWSDVTGELWNDDAERAEEKIVDFQERIEKLKSEDSKNDAQASNEENDSHDTSREAENEDNPASDELVDGMRPDFKEAMDSYEAFYDKYCEIVKKYTENPSDMELLADYTDMVTKAAEVTEKFEAWENGDLNRAELEYYLDVQNRVAKKLLEVSE